MMCPTCRSKQSKVVRCDQRANGQYRRERCCVHCGMVYASIEIDATMFTRLINLLRARRDLDQQLLEVCAWGVHNDQHSETVAGGSPVTLDTTTSSTC